MRPIKRKIIDKEFPMPRAITERARRVTLRNAHRFRGSVRITCGRFYTDEEYEAKRERILAKPLP